MPLGETGAMDSRTSAAARSSDRARDALSTKLPSEQGQGADKLGPRATSSLALLSAPRQTKQLRSQVPPRALRGIRTDCADESHRSRLAVAPLGWRRHHSAAATHQPERLTDRMSALPCPAERPTPRGDAHNPIRARAHAHALTAHSLTIRPRHKAPPSDCASNSHWPRGPGPPRTNPRKAFSWGRGPPCHQRAGPEHFQRSCDPQPLHLVVAPVLIPKKGLPPQLPKGKGADPAAGQLSRNPSAPIPTAPHKYGCGCLCRSERVAYPVLTDKHQAG